MHITKQLLPKQLTTDRSKQGKEQQEGKRAGRGRPTTAALHILRRTE